jgi:hypothetical protein
MSTTAGALEVCLQTEHILNSELQCAMGCGLEESKKHLLRHHSHDYDDGEIYPSLNRNRELLVIDG